MIKVVSTATKISAAGSVVAGLIGFGAFAGVAAADPESCWGGIGPGSDHQAFSVGSAADAGCVEALDESDTSMSDLPDVGTWGMTDIGAAGSYPGHNAAFTATPQTKVG